MLVAINHRNNYKSTDFVIESLITKDILSNTFKPNYWPILGENGKKTSLYRNQTSKMEQYERALNFTKNYTF